MLAAVVEGGPWQSSPLVLLGTQCLLTDRPRPVYLARLRSIPAD